MSFTSRTKKIIAIAVSAVIIGIIGVQPIKADTFDISAILSAIKEDTGNILATVNTLPASINSIVMQLTVLVMALNGPDSDPSSPTANLQKDFAVLYNINAGNDQSRKDMQKYLVSSYLKSNFTTLDENGRPIRDKEGNPQLSIASNVNDLVYQGLIGVPVSVASDKDMAAGVVNPAFNYVVNASGINIPHAAPASWQGSAVNQANYKTYYNSINAIQTYNSYVLSLLYADTLAQKDGNTLSAQQAALVKEANDSDWFQKVATENIGIVFRQLLIYNSQIFVLLTQMLQTQRQQLAVATMTNTLFIWANNFTENQLLQKAKQ